MIEAITTELFASLSQPLKMAIMDFGDFRTEGGKPIDTLGEAQAEFAKIRQLVKELNGDAEAEIYNKILVLLANAMVDHLFQVSRSTMRILPEEIMNVREA